MSDFNLPDEQWQKDKRKKRFKNKKKDKYKIKYRGIVDQDYDANDEFDDSDHKKKNNR